MTDQPPVPPALRTAAERLDAGEVDGILDLLDQVPEDSPYRAATLGLRGMTLFRQADYEGARRAYEDALGVDPGFAAGWIGLGNTVKELGELDGAESAYRKALKLEPDNPQAENNLGDLAQKRGEYEAAYRHYRRALELRPDFLQALFNLGNSLQLLGEFAEAIRCFQVVVSRDPSHIRAYNGIQSCGLRLRQPETVLEACRSCREADPDNQFSIAHEAFARMQMGDEAGFDRLYDLERFPHVVRLQVPAGYADLDDFNRQLEREVLDHPGFYWHKGDMHQTSPRGFNYGLMEDPPPAVEAFVAGIRQEVEAFMAALPEEPGHPFLGAKPPAFHMEYWATVLQSGGIHPAHSHEEAWLSGVYYCATGALEHDQDNPHAGWIVFDGFSDLTEEAGFHRKVREVRPEEGLMLVFPSYFLHQSRPFECADPESGAYRVSLAFDIQPRSG